MVRRNEGVSGGENRSDSALSKGHGHSAHDYTRPHSGATHRGTPGWTRVGLIAPDKRLRKRAAEELVCLIYDSLNTGLADRPLEAT